MMRNVEPFEGKGDTPTAAAVSSNSPSGMAAGTASVRHKTVYFPDLPVTAGPPVSSRTAFATPSSSWPVTTLRMFTDHHQVSDLSPDADSPSCLKRDAFGCARLETCSRFAHVSRSTHGLSCRASPARHDDISFVALVCASRGPHSATERCFAKNGHLMACSHRNIEESSRFKYCLTAVTPFGYCLPLSGETKHGERPVFQGVLDVHGARRT
jgi:hypothetical protein